MTATILFRADFRATSERVEGRSATIQTTAGRVLQCRTAGLFQVFLATTPLPMKGGSAQTKDRESSRLVDTGIRLVAARGARSEQHESQLRA